MKNFEKCTNVNVESRSAALVSANKNIKIIFGSALGPDHDNLVVSKGESGGCLENAFLSNMKIKRIPSNDNINANSPTPKVQADVVIWAGVIFFIWIHLLSLIWIPMQSLRKSSSFRLCHQTDPVQTGKINLDPDPKH